MFGQKLRCRPLFVAIVLALVMSNGVITLAQPTLAASSDEWTGNGDGHSWGDGVNWSTQHAPQPGDDVTVSLPAGARVTGAVGMKLHSLTLGENNSLSSATGTVPFTITSMLTWNSGEMDVSLDLAPGAVGTIGDQDKKTLGQNFKIEVHSGATLRLANIVNHPLVIWDPDTITIDRGATLDAIGTDELSFIACCVNPATIVNKGKIVLAKYMGATARLDLNAIALNQSGTVDTGHAGVADVRGPVSVNGGTVTGSGRLIIDTDEDHHVSGRIKITPSARVDYMAGGLFGSASVSGGGTWDLADGAIFARLTFEHGMVVRLSGGAKAAVGVWDKNNVGRIDNHGTANFTGGTLSIDSATQLVNEKDGVLNLSPGVTVTSRACCANPSRLINYGLLVVPRPPAGVSSGTPATIDGVSYQSNATTEIARGQVLALNLAPGTLSKSASLTGGGTMTVSGPLGLRANLPVARKETLKLLPHAALTAAPGNVALGSPGSIIDWTGGTVAGQLTIPRKVNLRISGPADKALVRPATGTTVLTTKGISTFAPGSSASVRNSLQIDPGQRWQNNGKLTFDGNTQLSSRACCVSPAMLANAPGAKLVFSPGPGKTVLDDGVQVTNQGGAMRANKGKVLFDYPSYVQTAGETQISNGAAIGQSQPTDAAQVGSTEERSRARER